MKRFGTTSLAIIIALSAALAGCGKPDANGSSQGAGMGGEKVLTIARSSDIIGFDVHNHGFTGTESVHVNMFNYLVKKSPDGKFQPDLALSWETTNPTTWRFKLREGVKFHNGDSFTAADVKFSLERVAKDQKLVEYGNYKQIKEVKIVDDYTVDIITSETEPVLLSRLSRLGSSMLPSKYIQEKGIEAFLKNPVGTGPYKFFEWLRDDRVTLVKTDTYFGDKPKWDKLVFRSIPEEATRVSELMTGGVDIAVQIPPTDMKRVNENKTTQSLSGPTTRVMMLALRTKSGPTSDPKVREAIDLAIDKKAIIKNLFEGDGKETMTAITPGIFGAKPDLFGKSQFDPDRAKQLLKEAGYEKGLTINFTGSVGKTLKDKETSEFIAAMLGEVGIKVNLEILESSKFNEKRNAGTTGDMFLVAYANSMFDAALLYKRLAPDTGYDNPEVLKLLSAAEKNMNAQEREKQFQQVQDILAKDRPQINLLQLVANYGTNKRLNFTPRIDEITYADEITLK
ncbi:ABC transporter substrate-binding protein [Paenibacillus radicis (ex Xue et al. 2023)]|uniref:ABC transporter substrate-binding protein n=1 Tax=Paenibacillus radicis (ex Xue et al. 2023) TaxID=2972489 RepID=A0ABT1YFC8_9BACL|nr:ABC transporter substrate-binding protein [Paenibacillus radicis (ex Xue et al. 2023)]MCR8631881.1 ABC transporter substrate-binding protein [Paenibacillus radicis (ex Xue et al. 2023)]